MAGEPRSGPLCRRDPIVDTNLVVVRPDLVWRPVLCVDEKSRIQALDRTAPILPLLPGTPQRRTHDYPRNGTTNLYAALDVASGKVITDLTPRHRAEEFRRFLNLIDTQVPGGVTVTLTDSRPRPGRGRTRKGGYRRLVADSKSAGHGAYWPITGPPPSP